MNFFIKVINQQVLGINPKLLSLTKWQRFPQFYSTRKRTFGERKPISQKQMVSTNFFFKKAQKYFFYPESEMKHATQKPKVVRHP